MPRLPRIQLEGAIYFVTSLGLHNQEVFKDRADYQMYLDLLAKYKNQHKFRLYAFSLLTDHLYLLIETGADLPGGYLPVRQAGAGATISEIMHDLTSLYTKYYNGRYHRRGHLFESRFKSVLIEKSNFLLQMTRHIHLAAKRELGADSGFSKDPKEYPYSSFLHYTSLSSPKSFGSHPREGGDQNGADSRLKHAGMTEGEHTGMTEGERAGTSKGLDISDEVREVLNFLANKDNPGAYQKYCLETDSKETEELVKGLRRTAVLGSDAFVEQVHARLEEREKDKEKTARLRSRARTYRTVVLVVGVGVLVASASAVYLYISKASLEDKYQVLLQAKETEFIAKSRFENRSPLGLTDLEGTAWEIEIVSPDGVTKDTLTFKDGRFSSEFAKSRGFGPASYFLTPRTRGFFAWQSAKSNAKGDTMTWSAEWRGDAMKGAATFTPAGQTPQNLSFFSSGWVYLQTESLVGMKNENTSE